jgi:hypothetical protein
MTVFSLMVTAPAMGLLRLPAARCWSTSSSRLPRFQWLTSAGGSLPGAQGQRHRDIDAPPRHHIYLHFSVKGLDPAVEPTHTWRDCGQGAASVVADIDQQIIAVAVPLGANPADVRLIHHRQPRTMALAAWATSPGSARPFKRGSINCTSTPLKRVREGTYPERLGQDPVSRRLIEEPSPVVSRCSNPEHRVVC